MKNTLKISNLKDDCTLKFQELIDNLNVNEVLKVNKGIYNITQLFLHSNMTLLFEEGAVLNLITDENKLVNINTRVAGINMPFYAAVLNVIDSKNVIIKGKGIINGNGAYFWEKYWGKDLKGGMRKEYDAKNLRFLCDYDCNRTRNVLVQNSVNIKISDIVSKDSGFWNVHILYSKDILIDNVLIDSASKKAPSTDGIDIDSSENVRVENCTTHTNDDSICIKSGRDSDGLKTNIPSKNITITNCTINEGFGITIGSEVSGGIEDVDINNIKFIGSDCGFRIKSAKDRKGYIKNINFSDISMLNVKYPIHIALNWNMNYNNINTENINSNLLDYQKALITPVSDKIKNTIISNIHIHNVESNIEEDYKGISRAFEIIGWDAENKIDNFIISNSYFNVKEFGRISYANVKFDFVDINVLSTNDKLNDNYDDR